ncbi:hypothetical protein [Mesorhizobium sp. 1B3]|uniref:hypothetical protein n=1 Tax=Mesorhizobium sp. 1B3 TaxID=3243599 RepID=UPI003D9762BF
MPTNLFLAYDLIHPGQNYHAVQTQIMHLGRWYKLQDSFYYVQTDMDMKAAHDFVRLAMDDSDKLAVIDARNAYVSNLPVGDLVALQQVFVRGPIYVPLPA